ncbi:MAG: peptidogalycan biosysnthesis protein [Nannocystaceae bacterium]
MKPPVRDLRNLESVQPAHWNRLVHGCSPFLEYGFLRALEASGSVGRAAGWEPHYLVAQDPAAGAPTLLGAVVAYVKLHSYGEYIFDWGWAAASEDIGVSYYPKLVLAVPATPATGRRILLAPGLTGVQRDTVVGALIDATRELADRESCSSIHWLFVTPDERDLLTRHGFWPRASFQFHWHNRGYSDFEAYLTALTSRKRKQIRKERGGALAQIDALEFVAGKDLCEEDTQLMEAFYRDTTAAYGGIEYLRAGFFTALAKFAPERLWFARARSGGRTCAGAVFLETPTALYGRYWGCVEQRRFLHFETAYYAGIERCIERQIPLFEAGAQGEHKLLRGFSPSATHSAHWIRHPALARGVRRFLTQESVLVQRRMHALATACPYRQVDAAGSS